MLGTSKQVKEVSQTSRVDAAAVRSVSSLEAGTVDCAECELPDTTDTSDAGTRTPIGGGGQEGDEGPWLARIARALWRFFTWPFRKIVNLLRGRIFRRSHDQGRR
jgi:hypothetical protein